MKQILQSLTTGKTEVHEIPAPAPQAGKLLIQTNASLVSAGTERMLVEFGQANWLGKARQQPDKVRQVLDKARTDGILTTLDAVQSKLDQPLPLGYCNVGTVIDVGKGVTGFQVGDRVVSNGPHAEIVCVPQNLCAQIPDAVTDDNAAFTVLGAIALQGIRLAQPTLGESFVVTGLGLIGLLAVQLLRAQGCRVLGLDFDTERLALARQRGAETVNLAAGEDPIAIAQKFSRGRGIDGVVITASTKSNEPVHQAAQMCRKRGRIVLVGVTGLELTRADFYEKELSFQVSCSYGPGRYDSNYEAKGQDYPVGFVRWTAQRNFEAVLDMMASCQLELGSLISHRFPLESTAQAYDLLSSDEPSLGILLDYSERSQISHSRTIQLPKIADQSMSSPAPSRAKPEKQSVVIGFIGSGNYATRILIPAFKETQSRMKIIANIGSVNSVYAGKKFGFQAATTDIQNLLNDQEINTVVIATRHNSHADLVNQALAAQKHVYVEKPLAITHQQLASICSAYQSAQTSDNAPRLMVGFNRRFAPHIKTIKAALKKRTDPKVIVMTVNAGQIPPDHWTQDPDVGGGRIIGEACHFIDLLYFLIGQPVQEYQVMAAPSATSIPADTVTITLTFADGSLGTIHYLANGDRSFPKERLEVFCGGSILTMDNFRLLQSYGWPDVRKSRLWKQDKGNQACAFAFINSICSDHPTPIPFSELEIVSSLTLKIAKAASE